jgi:hypothetical protein
MQLGEVLEVGTKLELAALVFSPAHVAQRFGQHCLQFYDVEAFAELARRTNRFYERFSERNALIFRARLDRLLREKGELPIDWTASGGGQGRASSLAPAQLRPQGE